MSSLGNYTTTEAVRGCLGVDESDMPDTMMVTSKLDLELVVELDSWLPTHATLYSDGVAGTPTTQQAAIALRIELYAQWFCAWEMSKRPLTVPQITTDGKAQFDRFKVDLERLTALCAEKVLKYKAELQELVLNITKPTGLPTALVSVATPTQDPITEGIQ